ncbi:MAG: gliding motility-associated C-terminal domain-containing protein [Bacteroidales bacterium]|nr:gliding motility-associated C-terminal domain-containing protein [Bacteroidales bacterium]
MKQKLKYILLIITVLAFGRVFSQSLITAKFVQMDSICTGTKGVVRLAMYDNVSDATSAQDVSHFRLMFEFDADLMKIESVITENPVFGSFDLSYPVSGQCMIVDTLANPINFRVPSSEETALIFKITFNGLKQGVDTLRFITDSCYFKTPEEENIAAFYHDLPDVNIHPGSISMTIAQTGIGCSYEEKGQAEVTILEGVSPYKYLWSDGMQNSFYPERVGQLSEGEVSVLITDGNGCRHDTSIMIKTWRAPEFDWTYETKYTAEEEFAVKEHPIRFYVTKEGSDSTDYAYNWEWKMYYTNPDSGIRDSLDLGERKNQTDFDYIFLVDNDYEIQLSAQGRQYGCDTTVVKAVVVEPAQLEFKNLVTPGNNRFKIHANGSQKLRDVFVSHVLIIQDRTGRKVYETKDFPDDGWDGGGCPNGTYYFILKAKSTRKEYKYQGAVVILGGNG